MQIAWEMNGEPLAPDHGMPLRICVPGYSAKTSCKWLTHIRVMNTDSDFGKHKSYYKLYPTSMRPGTDEYKEHFTDPEFTVSELNVNSVIFEPHSQTPVNAKKPFKVSGYAFTGGGRTIARIELSIDSGKTWRQVRDIEQDVTESGRLWSWARWQTMVDDFDPSVADAHICCRAWDCSGTTQPEWPIWNYTGMLNNSWFRVKVV